jgi:membrane protein YqaA with SNARE-associated domain
MLDVWIYAGLFSVAFGAATLLPLQSEAVLTGLLIASDHPAWMLIAVASLGNIGGSSLNFVLGRFIERFRHAAGFPVSADALRSAQDSYARYGKWSLLFSWVPVIGDPLTVVAGLMRERLSVFILFVTIAKTGRYLFLAAAVDAFV